MKRVSAPVGQDAVTRLDAARLLDQPDGLGDLLVDTVRGDASLGFLAGLERAEPAARWR
ncbi:hypothetical protein ACOBQB_03490 [Streptomyces sp. G5(2025)]|uniref:hypothetical protein n=1 Tax=Streptomyces sp. G5(2025) TaxID=3406628 RepID=UPI003C20601D